MKRILLILAIFCIVMPGYTATWEEEDLDTGDWEEQGLGDSTGSQQFEGDIYPTDTDTYDCGLDANRWNYGYFKYLNADGGITFTGSLNLTGFVTNTSSITIGTATYLKIQINDNLVVDGTLTTGSGKHALTNAAGLINGEKIQDDTIDDDSIDFGDVTGADLTLTDNATIMSIQADTGTLKTASELGDYNLGQDTGTLKTASELGDYNLGQDTGTLKTASELGDYNLGQSSGTHLEITGGTMTGLLQGTSVQLTGGCTAVAFYGDGSALTGISASGSIPNSLGAVYSTHTADNLDVDIDTMTSNNAQGIAIQTNGDSDDYLLFQTVSNIPVISIEGGSELKIKTSETTNKLDLVDNLGVQHIYLELDETTGDGTLNATTNLNIWAFGGTISMWAGDVGDYLAFRTVSNVPMITAYGMSESTASIAYFDSDDTWKFNNGSGWSSMGSGGGSDNTSRRVSKILGHSGDSYVAQDVTDPIYRTMNDMYAIQVDSFTVAVDSNPVGVNLIYEVWMSTISAGGVTYEPYYCICGSITVVASQQYASTTTFTGAFTSNNADTIPHKAKLALLCRQIGSSTSGGNWVTIAICGRKED